MALFFTRFPDVGLSNSIHRFTDFKQNVILKNLTYQGFDEYQEAGHKSSENLSEFFSEKSHIRIMYKYNKKTIWHRYRCNYIFLHL